MTNVIAARLRQRALMKIYEVFSNWSSTIPFTCRKGCSTCCTLGVTMSESEGELIIDFLDRSNSQQWQTAVRAARVPQSVSCTTNEFASACLNQQDLEAGGGDFTGTCPLLDGSECSIYPVRPFSCRCFASTKCCRPGSEAEVPSYYLAASTAVAQVIEHLDQGRYWGSLVSLLRHLLSSGQKHPPENLHLLIAQPFPGFLIDADDYVHLKPLLDTLLNSTVDGFLVQDLCNGRFTLPSTSAEAPDGNTTGMDRYGRR